MEHLIKALLQYTNLNLETPEGRQLLMTHFFNQCYSDIRAKLRHLEKGPLTLQTEVLEAAFKVYHVRNDKACNHCYELTTAALLAEVADHLIRTTRAAPPPPGVHKPPGPCFKCHKMSHWARG